MAEKMRVHTLARVLKVPSKVIVEKCRAEGIMSVKNHMSTLSAGLHATICEWFTDGTHEGTLETSQRVDLEKVRLSTPPPSIEMPAKVNEDAPPLEVPSEEETIDTPVLTEVSTLTAVAEAPSTTQPSTKISEVPAAEVSAPTDDGREIVTPRPTEVPAEVPAVESDVPATQEPKDAKQSAPTSPQPVKPATPVAPAGPQHVPMKAKLQGPRVVRYEAPERDIHPFRPPPRESRRVDAPPATGPATAPPSQPGKVGRKDADRRKGRINPRRSTGRLAESGERLAEWRDQDLIERKERLAGATGRRIFRRRAAQQQATGGPLQARQLGPKTEATVREPVRMKEFCSETGLNFLQCLKVLREEHELVANVNMTLPSETAELLALHFGIELTVIPSKTLLDELEEEFAARVSKHEELRPPVVAMLGHVDHGKTSLLDAIRNTNVATGEDGGITQHIGASHIDTPHGAVTFLDTPGHEAFTAMRARGAELTDVVVLVVAADDGVMPQTVEAINHAKAAEVPIVVALNKIDLGDQNKLKIYGQLAEQGLAPSGEWGGETDVIGTSALNGGGIAELLEHLAALGGLLNLKADPTLAASGTVIEAETKPGVGAVARVLIQNGTLHVGDFVVCGPASGKVRALLNDKGQRISDAGPSIPVEVWGLDEVAAASDRLYVVDRLQRAKEIARRCKSQRVSQARTGSRKAKSLEDVLKQRNAEEIPELHLIIKADTDGSVSALKQALDRFAYKEVRLTIRHAGVGAVTDSDVVLASACEGIVAAFRVEAASAVRRKAEHSGVDIRHYRVIYELCDDIKKALEGLLAPEERIEPRSVAVVREIFRFGKKIGMVAGTIVSEGVVDRKHFAKVVRDGVVVRDRCKFQSLRRFKDDVREVRAGLECGIRLEGFDDIHVGDRIETFEVVSIARTL